MFDFKSKLTVACASLVLTVATALLGIGACSQSEDSTGGGSGNNAPCGGSCPVGASCVPHGDTYACQCQPGLTACNGACVDLSSSASNCGACGIACGGDVPYCSAGACAASCAEGTTACGFDCTNTSSNPYHCGGCGVTCEGGLACSGGTCGCAAGTSCGGNNDGTGGNGPGPGDGEYGGYLTAGNWKGYAWTAPAGDSTITPEDFSAVTDFPLCVSGTVNPGYDNVAMVGWNINQQPEDDPNGSTILPALDGITVSITNNSSTQLRIQIQGPNGATDPNNRWCAEIGTGGSNIFVPYESFNTKCWPLGPTDTPGNPYAGEEIVAVMIMVPGPDPAGTATNFNFCVDRIEETTEDGNTGGAGCDLSAGLPGSPLTGAMSLANPYERKALNSATKQYFVQVNAFSHNNGSCSGCNAFNLSYNNPGDGLFRITQVSGSMPTNNAPYGYPSVFIGSNNGGDGFSTLGSNLPKRVSDLTSVPTGWAWTAPANGQYNAAYDVWFSTSSAGETGVGSRTFLMVWFYRTTGINAEGESDGPTGGLFNINGKTFTRYVSTQFEGRPIVSYVAKEKIDSWSFDLLDFINDAKMTAPNVVKDDYYLTNIFAGFEIWSGSEGIRTDAFCANVN